MGSITRHIDDMIKDHGTLEKYLESLKPEKEKMKTNANDPAVEYKYHDLKTCPEHFEEVFMGRKTFEARKNDRGFEVGHHVILHEYDPKIDYYTGRKIARRVTSILHGPGFGIEDGFCIMSIQ